MTLPTISDPPKCTFFSSPEVIHRVFITTAERAVNAPWQREWEGLPAVDKMVEKKGEKCVCEMAKFFGKKLSTLSTVHYKHHDIFFF